MSPDSQSAVDESLAALRDCPDQVFRRPSFCCSVHPDRDAEAVCADCGVLLCGMCARLDPDSLATGCEACVIRRGRRQRRATVLSVAASPAFYVVLVTLLALTAYLLGWGNPSLEDLRRRDEGRAWYMQDAGRLALDQAERAAARVEALQQQGRPEQCQPWARLAAGALDQISSLWADDTLAIHLHIGKARMLARAGDPEAALALLQDTAVPSSADRAALKALSFHRGVIALQVGRFALGEKELKQVAQAIPSENREVGSPRTRADDMVDAMLGLYAGDRREARMHLRIRRVCGSAGSEGALREEALRVLASHGLASADAGSEVTTRMSVKDSGQARKPPKRPSVQIRHFEEE